jgi:hypothetical protein
MRFVRLLSLLSFVVLLTHGLVGSVRAQPSSADRVLATDLFQRGRAALVAGDYATACPLLEESQRLDPAGGTLLNLALCHEQIGRIATAWSEFLEGLSVARREHREDRVRYAREHITALEARLSRLVVKMEQTELPGMIVERDGTALGRYAWGVATPVDPGEHTVRVRAPGYREFVHTVTVSDNADLVTVLVPALVVEPAPEATVELPAPASPAEVTPPAEQLQPVQAKPTQQSPAPRRRRRAALAMWGVGAATAIAATVCGVRSLNLRSAAEDNCQEMRCSELAYDQNERASRHADASTALAVISGLSAGAGLWLWLVREPTGERAKLGGLGLGLNASF